MGGHTRLLSACCKPRKAWLCRVCCCLRNACKFARVISQSRPRARSRKNVAVHGVYLAICPIGTRVPTSSAGGRVDFGDMGVLFNCFFVWVSLGSALSFL